MDQSLLRSACIWWSVLALAAGAQTTWHVQAGAIGPGTGTATSPFPAIQQGIDAATHGDLVLIRPGTYAEMLDLHGKAIELRGRDGAPQTILDPAYAGRAILIANAPAPGVVLAGLTIRRGGGLECGGGLRCTASIAAITECHFEENGSSFGLPPMGQGAAIYSLNSSLDVKVCVFKRNAALEGRGIYALFCPRIAVLDSCFEQNSGFLEGGGINAHASTLLVGRSEFVGNHAHDAAGGAIFLSSNASATIKECRFHGNSAVAGGAVAGTTSTFEDCSFTENWCTLNVGGAVSGGTRFGSCRFIANHGSSLGGGAVSSSGLFENCLFADNIAGLGSAIVGSPVLRHCTILGNVSISNLCGGGPICSYWGGVVTIVSSIVRGNTPNNLPAAGGYVARYCNIEGGFPGPTNFDADPLFVDRVHGDFRLTAASPCRNAGSAAIAGQPFADFEGNPRNWESTPDVGMDEYVPRLPGTPDDLVLVSEVDGAWPLTGTKPVLAGEVIDLGLYSPATSLAGGTPYLAVSSHPTSLPPPPNTAVPALHVDPLAMALLVEGPIAFPAGLPAEGVTLWTVVPPGLAGLSFRLQGAVFSPAATNGLFALTDAHDLVAY